MSTELLTPLVTKGAQSPLFIVPAPGTTPFSLIKLARSLKSGRPVYSFEPPGFEGDSLTYGTIEKLASAYITEIKTVQATGPYYLGGHCGGALIALEMAKQIESQFDEVALLIILEAITPKRVNIATTEDKVNSKQESASMECAMQTVFEHINSQLTLLPRNHAEHFGKVTYHLLQMADKYRAPSVKAPIVHIHTRTHTAMAYQGWRTVTTSGIKEHIISGDTYSILAPPIVTTLADKFDQLLL